MRLVLGDQLSPGISSLADADPGRDVILICEVMAEATYVPHHPQKIAFLFSAMRHFAAELVERGFRVDYVRLEDEGNSGSFRGEAARALSRHGAERLVVAHPGEWRVLADMLEWEPEFGVPVEIREDNRFFCTQDEFRRYAEGRRNLVLEFFYREMRRRTGLLMDAFGEPEGGQWNFDKENRKSLPAGIALPEPFAEEPDAITRDVLALVARKFGHHFGALEPFGFAVTAAGAERALERFLADGLPGFGDYQDAMKQGEDRLFHSVLSGYMNAGLLDPRDVCRRAEEEYRAGRAPLNSVEGFIRQILGWREYLRGVYWLKMPGYAETNHLGAGRPLPNFYWTGKAPMNCVRQTVDQTRRTAHAHHIQRLMVTGNFALLLGVEPAQIEEWYLAVYFDAYDWVELPNVHGMVMHADGGFIATKPYAASGKYINRMSDYCGSCVYDVRKTVGPRACPFNLLYWNFLMENAPKLRGNRRLWNTYWTLDRMSEEKKAAIQVQANKLIKGLAPKAKPRWDGADEAISVDEDVVLGEETPDLFDILRP